MILHVGEPERAAAELARVLRPGGRLALTVWDLPERCRALGVFTEAAGRGGAQPLPDLPEGPPFFRFADPVAFTALFEGAGLVDVAVRTVGFVHRVDPGAWWRGVLASTARTGPVIERQEPAVRERIRAAYDELVAPYLREGVAELPASVVLAAGARVRT